MRQNCLKIIDYMLREYSRDKLDKQIKYDVDLDVPNDPVIYTVRIKLEAIKRQPTSPKLK